MYSHSNPVPRRSHKKSSTGCKACKLRKVKCDEKKPVCGKCALHFSNLTACEYDTAPKAKAKAKKASAVASTQLLPRPSSNSTSSPGPAVSEIEKTSCQISDKAPSLSLSARSPGSFRLLLEEEEKERSRQDCACPCHQPEYTHMLLDAVLGICRICGNQPHPEREVGICIPVLSDKMRMAGKVDSFSVLPAKSSPRVHAPAYHWTNVLALFPTKIDSQYCTNPTWMSRAVNNETFFNATLYVSSLHDAGLRGKRGTSESLYYKAETIRLLNKSLRDPKEAISDENLAAVLLLTHVVSLIGEPDEAEIHMKGLRQMMALRGGIQEYNLDGVFLHMLCIVNHLTAVISETPTIIPPSGIPYNPGSVSCSPATSEAHTSPLIKPFAISFGFHPTVVDILHDMGYLYFVVDAFTAKLLPEFRQCFEDLVRSIEMIKKMEGEREKEWVLRRLRTWGERDLSLMRNKTVHATY